MERDVLERLAAWKKSSHRKPLMLKGARQVGKTWALREFGRRAYKNVAYFSLENIAPGVPSEYAAFFSATHDPRRIVANLSLASGQAIEPKDTLLILDEIQDCPAAVGALKYFCEDAPEYHVACAGSLLGVMLARSEGSFPVGKVTFLDMGPLTFSEFLRGVGMGNLDAYAQQVALPGPVPPAFESQLTEQLMRYCAVGGMPEVVAAWASTRRMDEVDAVLSDLIDSYERDFAKHGGRSLFAKLSLVWHSLPTQLARENKKFVYGVLRSGARAREYEEAIEWLIDAGLLLRVHRMKAPGIPLSAYDDPAAFKLYALDVGVLRRLSQLDARAFGIPAALFREFKGAFAENYVLQQLRGQLTTAPRYWTNEKPRHEVDFVVQLGNDLVPIEVKSGENVGASSLRYYARKYADATPLRVRLSLRNLSLDDDVLNIPLYLANQTPRLVGNSLA